MSSTDKRNLEIKFRFPLGQHIVVTYTVLAARCTGYAPLVQRTKRFLKM